MRIGERIFVHCVKDGHKIDALKRNDKVSLCVIDRDQVVPQECTTYYCGVFVGFGRARIIEDEAEKCRALQALAAKYTPDDEEGRLAEAKRVAASIGPFLFI